MSDERKPMTDEELAAIQDRLTKATPGPWVHGQNGGYVILGYKPEKKRIDGYGADDHVCVLDDGDHHQYRSEDEQLANAAFIANAPTDIARLLAEVERLNKVSHYLAERLSPLNVTRRKYIGATLEDGYGSALFLTREEAVQSWLDEANREVSNAK